MIGPTELAVIAAATDWVADVLGGDAAAVGLHIGQSLPAEVRQKLAARLAGAETRAQRAVALLPALDVLVYRSPLDAIGMGFALGRFWNHLPEPYQPHAAAEGRLRNTAIIVESIAFALSRAGAHGHLIEYANELASPALPLTTQALAVLRAEALLRTGRPAEARACLPSREMIEEAAAGQRRILGDSVNPGPTLVTRDNVAQDLDRLEKGAIGELPAGDATWRRVMDETREAVANLLRRANAKPGRIADARARLDTLADKKAVSTQEQLERMASLVRLLELLLGDLAPGLDFGADKLDSFAAAFSPRAMPADQLPLQDLDASMAKALQRGDADSWQSYAWMKATFLERAGDFKEALVQLEAIKASREALADSASSPAEKAGLASAFGNLAQRLATLRGRLGGSYAQVFEAIEWGKGRWLSDAIGTAIPAFDQFRATMTRHDLDYLTYAVGSDATLAMFVPASGDPVCAEIPIGRDAVAVEIRTDARSRAGLTELLAARLGALTNWLPAMASESIGRTLMIAPSGPMHDLPLHALPMQDGEPLAPRRAVVRTHGATMMSMTAPPVVPRAFLALRAPVLDERNEARRKQSFDGLVAALPATLRRSVLDGTGADFDTLLGHIQPSQVVHLWAHGGVAPDGRYYTRSGLLLAHQGQLSPRGWAAFDTRHLLSPARVTDALPLAGLAGSHLTLQACVSGLANANLQGDAIGLEWAFLLGGAASVLATHWDVDYPGATMFCQVFYDCWLGQGHTRAQAWRRAAAHCQAALPGTSAAWAAFSLTGEWR